MAPFPDSLLFSFSDLTMRKNKLITAVAAAVMLGSWLVLYLVFRIHPPFDPIPHQALGEVIADETKKLVGPGGGVYLFLRDPDLFESPAVEAQQRALCRGLEKAGIKVNATNYIKLDPLRVASIPAGDYPLLIKRATEKDVVVSLLGLPGESRDPSTKTVVGDPAGPKVVALCTGPVPSQIDLPKAFQNGVVHVAVVDRFAAMRGPKGDGPRQVFDSLYQVVTASDVGPWAETRKGAK